MTPIDNPTTNSKAKAEAHQKAGVKSLLTSTDYI